MHYHIILTERCNLRCKYCYEKSMQEFDNDLEKKWDYDLKAPCDSEVDVEKINSLLKDGDSLIFYGGEPLIKLNKIKEIMDCLESSEKRISFCIQTNGFFLKNIPDDYLKKFSKMLVSIDGNKERTEINRGNGSYDFVLKNLRDIRERGFEGEIVARMTVSFPDIFQQVSHVNGLIEEGVFDSVHWQLDAGFYKNDFDLEKFSKFVDKYNFSVDKLVDFWIEKMKGGKVLKLYPFLGIFNRLMKWDEETRLPCGSGYANYTITTSGKLSACPIMNSVKNFYCGSVDEGVKKEISCGGVCKECNYLNVCGGRCLYSNYAQLWPREGEELICKTIIHLIESLRKRISEVEDLIERGVIKKEDFDFEKYFGPEIIP